MPDCGPGCSTSDGPEGVKEEYGALVNEPDPDLPRVLSEVPCTYKAWRVINGRRKLVDVPGTQTVATDSWNYYQRERAPFTRTCVSLDDPKCPCAGGAFQCYKNSRFLQGFGPTQVFLTDCGESVNI